MKIKTKILCTMLAMSVLVALVGALAVNRQRVSAMNSASREAENVARALGFGVISDSGTLDSKAQEIVTRLHLTEGRDVVLVDTRKRVVADADPQSVGKIFIEDQNNEVDATLRDGTPRRFFEEGSADHPAGVKQIVAQVQSNSGEVLGAVILEYGPLYEELMRATSSTIRELVIAGFSSVAIALLLALYMGRSIARPLGILTEMATGFAAGRMDLPMPSVRKDEIGQLTTAFKNMVQKRQQAEGELRRMHDELEGRVVERTVELAKANGALQAENIERKSAEETLRESEEKFRQLAANVTDVFYMTSPDMQLVHYVSPAYEEVWGHSMESLYANPCQWGEAILPEEREGVIAAFSRLATSESSVTKEFRIARPDGTVRWICSRGYQVRDTAGKVVRITGIASDITERKRAERALTTSEERTRLVVATAHDAFVGMDCAGLITDWNPQAKATFGWSREEAVGRPMYELIIPSKFREVHVQDLKHFLATGDGPGMNKLIEVSAIHRDGREMPIELMISPICIGDSFIFSASIRDITERKRAEAELKQAKEAAEAASRAKSEFLANMSHEIRTPMNGIIGMTELVLDTELNREQREFLGMAKSSAHALLGLINDILDFSKIEAGKLELEAISFSLRECIGTMLKPLGMRADQKGLELTADIPAVVPDHLIGDPMRLRQILINLTDNAIKFTERGDVTLHVAVESATDDEHCLHFSVADTGIGIPAEKQALIFEAFTQADGTTTRTYGGSGLGLAIASQLVRQMGGRIWVQSTVGEGTTFHFTVHVPVRHTPAPNVRHADPHKLEGLRVLVVDDNAVNRRILREMLAHWRMQPTVVASGAAAIVEMLRAARAGTPFPLVILDGMMPEMDGFMVAEQIREHAELCGATVMMLSSAMPAGASARCAKLGVASYLMKPVSQVELIDAILIALGGAAALEPAVDAAPIVRAASRLRILLAEDNVINRAVAAGILEKRGHSLVHAANGREAVEAAAREVFDLIFMDVQMPEMDGFEATGRIRESEQSTGRHTPIVAMTAHAKAGDRERCLAAGMDDYLSKPLQKAELLALLEQISAGRNSADAAAPPTAPNGHGLTDFLPVLAPESSARVLPIFSREKLLAELDGDEALMGQLITLFHENTPRLLDDIRGSVARRGSIDLARSAHALLSSLGAFGANEARDLTQQLEAQAHDENYEHTDRTFAALERETGEIHLALAAFTPARA